MLLAKSTRKEFKKKLEFIFFLIDKQEKSQKHMVQNERVPARNRGRAWIIEESSHLASPSSLPMQMKYINVFNSDRFYVDY
jgi:hypothetical protein